VNAYYGSSEPHIASPMYMRCLTQHTPREAPIHLQQHGSTIIESASPAKEHCGSNNFEVDLIKAMFNVD
jgi:hypothetical protein